MAIFKHPEQRVGVFIDTQNLYHSAKNIYHARVNFGNVLKDSVEDRRLIRARAYMVTTENRGRISIPRSTHQNGDRA